MAINDYAAGRLTRKRALVRQGLVSGSICKYRYRFGFARRVSRKEEGFSIFQWPRHCRGALNMLAEGKNHEASTCRENEVHVGLLRFFLLARVFWGRGGDFIEEKGSHMTCRARKGVVWGNL